MASSIEKIYVIKNRSHIIALRTRAMSGIQTLSFLKTPNLKNKQRSINDKCLTRRDRRPVSQMIFNKFNIKYF